MADTDATLDAFRAEISQWIETACPASLRGRAMGEDMIVWGGRQWQFAEPAQKEWLDAAIERGMTAPRWPTEYGGAGLSRAQEKIYREEMARLQAPPPLESFGLWMLGPALLAFGDDAQKARHLPPITRGEIRWCQGYSEPGAGSDLANVQTRAEDMGDHYLVNGQKIWTSYADKADWIFALVRTDREAPKHKGISFLLMDMESAGITTRPIRLISGKSPFCETFFDNVKVPKENLVGERNRGWDIAKYLLTHEREMIGGGARGLLGGRSLGQFLGGLDGAMDDPVTRAEAMACEVNSLAFAMTMERYKDQAEAGQGVGNASAMLKYYGTELNKRRYELLMNAAGSEALEWDGPHGGLAPEWLRTKANSIEGGTSEVMLDILAKRVLELPNS
ncbi:acyl-CoA dehydrogenase family protein [Lutimaribacter sp. EGI FJ00015]|uniref:Acyl-CoA dehydrogenase family protein n=1 Tax=Lutimaribacter degradans TaxID=2945989 RepID=A0ACC5ZWR1_9RHOB|nr:acyl-CoA dehydrogenase family protein [Lutimaribacter sp. EGI FJ00013]MCM2562530.1 acyl-CoA dehydrogenase family protein [Lutimaribacter sp. EGI FJ00013]MCO0613687.1 acyl-CoA dehydrogenase family protein [Lutimaribacter sp. EGI FJ00015]MCO0636830.1 acyl-CoA dehydrogenase family protein [Lutimaribacter sp. EGI FJ00014]